MIIISDLHIGRQDSKIKEFKAFLKNHLTDELVLNGDIFDQSYIKNWGKNYQTIKEIRKILKGTKIYYNIGNHDSLFMLLMPIGFLFGVKFRKKLKTKGVVIFHGDWIKFYLWLKGVKSSGSYREDCIRYAELINKTIIVGHSHHPARVGNVIDVGDWVKYMMYEEI